MAQRLDQALVARGLAESRARARAMIEAGGVAVNGRPAAKPSQAVDPSSLIEVAAATAPWVSRAAVKLLHALDHWDLTPEGAEALDVGASTGGFTEVLLARGASRVHAVDVGRGQLHPRIAGNERVIAHEGVNARNLPQGLIPPVDWIVMDVSFISLTKVAPAPMALGKPGARLVALVKPQFEVGPGAVGKGGIVRDEAARARAVETVRDFVSGEGWAVEGVVDSPIAGGDGNREYLLTARAPG